LPENKKKKLEHQTPWRPSRRRIRKAAEREREELWVLCCDLSGDDRQRERSLYTREFWLGSDFFLLLLLLLLLFRRAQTSRGVLLAFLEKPITSSHREKGKKRAP
jgi:hypothetical protein